MTETRPAGKYAAQHRNFGVQALVIEIGQDSRQAGYQIPLPWRFPVNSASLIDYPEQAEFTGYSSQAT